MRLAGAVLSVTLAGCFSDPPTVMGSDTDAEASSGAGGTAVTISSSGEPPPPTSTSMVTSADASSDASAGSTTAVATSGESTTASSPGQVVYAFTDDPCGDAVWTWSNSDSGGSVACKTDPGSLFGSVEVLMSAELQDGSLGGPVLQFVPPADVAATAQGNYAAWLVSSGERFVTRIACPADAPECEFTWEISARQPGSDTTLFSDGDSHTALDAVRTVDIDLTEHDGIAIEFTFLVTAGGTSSGDDIAYFFRPRIVSGMP